MALARTNRGHWGQNGTAFATNTNTSAVTDNFTPSDNSLLLVILTATYGGAQSLANFTIAGGGLTWQDAGVSFQTASGDGNTLTTKIWFAEVTTGASMAITATLPSMTNADRRTARSITVLEYTGYDATDPIGAIITGINQGSGAVTLTLPSAPASTSEVVAGCSNIPSTTVALTATPATGWTEQYDHAHSGFGHTQIQTRAGSTSTSIDWDDVAVGGTVAGDDSMAFAIEIKASSSVNHQSQPGIDTLAITGQGPAIATSASVAPDIDTLAITGQAPSVRQGLAVLPAQASLTITGHVPTIARSASVAPGIDTLALTGLVASVAANAAAAPGIDTLALSGNAPTVSRGAGVSPAADALALSGNAPDVAHGATVAPAQAALAIEGHAPSVQLDDNVAVSPDRAQLALTGHAPIITGTASVAPAQDALIITGHAPTVAVGTNVAVAPANDNLSLTGLVAAIAASALIAIAAPDALTITGQAPSVSIGATVSPGIDTLEIAGAAPTVARGATIVPAAPDAIVIEGKAPSVATRIARTPDADSLAINGFAPNVRIDFQYVAAPERTVRIRRDVRTVRVPRDRSET